MSISFQCDGCGKSLSAVPAMAGRRVKCRECGNVVQIPGGASPRARPQADGGYGLADAPRRRLALGRSWPRKGTAATSRRSEDRAR